MGTSRAKVHSGRTLANGTSGPNGPLSNGCSVLPANPTSVAAYLSCCVDAGAGQSAVKLARSAITAHHKDAGQPPPTHGEYIKRLVAGMASSVAEPNTESDTSDEPHAGVSHRNLSQEGGHGHQPELGTSGAAKGSKGMASRISWST